MRVAIISEPDTVWFLSGWERAAALLRSDGHTIVGIWTCPAALAKHRGLDVPLWYLRTLGPADFVKLAAFACLAHVRRLIGAMAGTHTRSFKALAVDSNAHYGQCRTPNDPAFIDWLRSERIDVLLIQVGYILGEKVLAAPAVGVVNKHASALPANRGLMPYLWAKLHGTPQGVSYHLVTPGIDEGALLVQDRAIAAPDLTTMTRFYLYAYRMFPERIRQCVDLLTKGVPQPSKPSAVTPSYHGLPTKADVEAFRLAGGRIISWADLRRAFEL